MWDIILTQRLGETGRGVVYGLAVDDAHTYHGEPEDRRAYPGRGWVMVRAAFLTPEHLIAAMERAQADGMHVILDSIFMPPLRHEHLCGFDERRGVLPGQLLLCHDGGHPADKHHTRKNDQELLIDSSCHMASACDEGFAFCCGFAAEEIDSAAALYLLFRVELKIAYFTSRPVTRFQSGHDFSISGSATDRKSVITRADSSGLGSSVISSTFA
jgi:hypothetical protein